MLATDDTVAVLVATVMCGCGNAAGAAAGGFAPCLRGIVDPQRDVAHAVAMQVDVFGDRMPAAQRRGQHEANLSLLHHIRSAIALAGLRSRIGHQRMPKAAR